MEMEPLTKNIITGSCSSVTNYIINLSRSFKLLPSARTTLLTFNEEMQIFQYCAAMHNKKMCGKFDATVKASKKLHSDLFQLQLSDLKSKVDTDFFNKDKIEGNEGDTICTQSTSNELTGQDKYQLQLQDKNRMSNDFSPTSGGTNLTKNNGSPAKNAELCDTEKPQETEEDDLSVAFLFLESLKASNHCTILDVFERFLNAVIIEASDLYLFVKSDYKTNTVTVGEVVPLREVEILTDKVLKSIAGIGTDELCNQSSQSVNKTDAGGSLNDSLSLSQNLMMSPSISRLQNTPRCSIKSGLDKTPKTPVDLFRKKHQYSPSSSPSTPSTVGERQEILKKFIENIFRCYLHLLVNTRCELALAFVFNIPCRELNHEAFTHLKHASASYGLSMYQTLSSMLMRVRLGGHAYAPPSDSPIMLYIKGLSNLFDLIDKFVTVTEETPSPRSACKRVVNILKRSISACKSGKFPHSVVEAVANGIWDRLDDILAEMEKGKKGEDSEKSVSEGGSMSGQQAIKAIQTYLDQTIASMSDVDQFLLKDVRFSEDTPTRFPCFMSQFRSPLLDIAGDNYEDNDESVIETNAGSSKQNNCHVSEALYMNEGDNDNMVCTPLDINTVYVIPSKTIVHPRCGAEYGQTDSSLFSPAKKVTGNKESRKRAPNGTKKQKKKDAVSKVKDGGNQVMAENSPEPKSKKPSPSLEVSESGKSAIIKGSKNVKGNNKIESKSCRRKLLPQIKGQSKITGFFKV